MSVIEFFSNLKELFSHLWYFVYNMIRIAISPKSVNFYDENALVDCAGKIVLITGANKGIGLSSAREFLRRGATVLFACRSETKAQNAIYTLEKELLLKPNRMLFIQLDLSSIKSVQNFILNLKTKLENEYNKAKIDIVVCNAAGLMDVDAKTSDNLNATMQTNYLGHYYLTRCLLEGNLLSENGCRLVHVTSSMHKFASMTRHSHIPNQKNLLYYLFNKNISRARQYSNSKLLNILFSNELSRRFEEANSKHTTIAVHPGFIYTDFQNHFSPKFILPLTRFVTKFFNNTPLEGTQSILKAALSKEWNLKRGLYIDNCMIAQPIYIACYDQVNYKLMNRL